MDNIQNAGVVQLFAIFSEWTRYRLLHSYTPNSSQVCITWENQDPILDHLVEERENGKDVKIYRVPNYIKQEISPDDFKPQELFVGFYLHTELKVEDEMDMDISKLAILREFCRESATDGPPTSHPRLIRPEAWTDLVSKVGADAMTRARSKYDRLKPADNESMERENSLVMMDALFIVAYLQFEYDFSESWGYNFQPVFRRSRFNAQRFSILRDLLILENQIPMSLLKVMLKCLRRPSTLETADSILQNLLEWFVMAIYPFNHGAKLDKPKDLQQHLQYSHKDRGVDSFISCDHLLHCAYLAICGPERYSGSDEQSRSRCCPDAGQVLPCFRPREEDLEAGSGEVPLNKFRVPSATSLRRVGIKVRVRDDSLTLPSIQFFKRKHKFVLWHEYVLLVPKLIMHDDTAPMFRNLGLYEQIKDDGYFRRGDMRTYLYLMSSLLDTVEDVQLLINRGVIVNLLGSAEAVCKKWNHMFDGLYIPNDPPAYWVELQKKIRELERSKSNRWFAEFRDRNLSSAVIFASSIIFAVIFVATVGQTIYAVLAYYEKSTTWKILFTKMESQTSSLELQVGDASFIQLDAMDRSAVESTPRGLVQENCRSRPDDEGLIRHYTQHLEAMSRGGRIPQTASQTQSIPTSIEGFSALYL
ncbi:hypothetical protein R1sor_022487 [Riccia sorocarpa]|uniref:Uncharacterized protein n=1 Tax=Riccia sorocarpa TaxID=122646 RepID=A0ABD3GLR1_9MARC